jgi:NADPH:quinone reductase-like Zn-dependent oxidoreductase
MGRVIRDAVIITAASSSVGLAAKQIANAAGAISIAATRTSAKREALLGHGAQHVITDRRPGSRRGGEADAALGSGATADCGGRAGEIP